MKTINSNFPIYFYIIDCIYEKSDLLFNINYNKPLTIQDIRKFTNERKKHLNYAYAYKNIKWLIDNNYLIAEKKGRCVYINLSKNGVRLAESIHFLIHELEYK